MAQANGAHSSNYVTLRADAAPAMRKRMRIGEVRHPRSGGTLKDAGPGMSERMLIGEERHL